MNRNTDTRKRSRAAQYLKKGLEGVFVAALLKTLHKAWKSACNGDGSNPEKGGRQRLRRVKNKVARVLKKGERKK